MNSFEPFHCLWLKTVLTSGSGDSSVLEASKNWGGMTQHGQCSLPFSLFSQDDTWASPNLSSSGDMLKIYKVCSDFISHSTAQQGVQVGSGGMGWGGLLGGWVNLFLLQILGGSLYFFQGFWWDVQT